MVSEVHVGRIVVVVVANKVQNRAEESVKDRHRIITLGNLGGQMKCHGLMLLRLRGGCPFDLPRVNFQD